LDLGLEPMFLRDSPQKANMSVHFRFGPKATVADKNVIRRWCQVVVIGQVIQ